MDQPTNSSFVHSLRFVPPPLSLSSPLPSNSSYLPHHSQTNSLEFFLQLRYSSYNIFKPFPSRCNSHCYPLPLLLLPTPLCIFSVDRIHEGNYLYRISQASINLFNSFGSSLGIASFFPANRYPKLLRCQFTNL